MKFSARILIGAVIGLVVIAAGLAVGVYFSTHKTSSVTKQASAPVAAPIPPNPNIYDISPPSRADISKTQTINIPPSRSIAYVMLPKDEAADIKADQQILLYDKNRTLLETFGSIRAVNDGSGPFENMVTIHIMLDNPDGIDTSKAVRADVITGRIPNVARLPLSALVRDNQDEPHVWRAQTGNNGNTIAKFAKINVASATYDFFIIDEASHVDGGYILNPDKNLKDGQEIKVRQILYAGPSHTDESRMAERVRQKKVQRDNEAAQKAAAQGASGGGAAGNAAGNCGAPSAAGGGSGASSCAPQPGAVQQFMRSIEELSPAVTAQPAPATETPAPAQGGNAP